jgi:transposase-like protein
MDFLFGEILYLKLSRGIYAVEISFALRKEVEVRRIEPITNTTNCIFCSCSNVVKFGVRRNSRGDIQKLRCNDCELPSNDYLFYATVFHRRIIKEC